MIQYQKVFCTTKLSGLFEALPCRIFASLWRVLQLSVTTIWQAYMKNRAEIDLLERKTSRIEIRVSDRELRLIDAAAQETGLNRSEYLIARGLKQVCVTTRNVAEPNYVSLAQTLRELKAQGNNLNQMTRALHIAIEHGSIFDLGALETAIDVNYAATQAIIKVMQGDLWQ
jgi:uncharacterized protein (DUF1778 family)